MNDPNKAINVNLSSLLSLKAELLRKQEEVNKAKATRVTAADYTPNKLPSIKSNNKKDRDADGEKDEEVISYEVVDVDLLAKSQRTLEAKSRYYDRMTRSGGDLNSDDHCLVLFNRKKNEHECETVPNNRNSASDHSSSGSDTDDDDDWVEYIDCLGRTRKCLREDLENVKKRDKDLADSMPERLDQSKANWMLDMKRVDNKRDPEPPLEPNESVFGEVCSVMSKHDEMRANWEKKDEENLQKADIHYQDVFFDEARQHGVGYYAFSTDETERTKQQRDLKEARKKTETQQQNQTVQREQREKIIAERVRAAKNRQRARLGLPPLEEIDDEKAKATDSENKVETKEERRERKRAEKQKRKQEKNDAEKEQQRKNYVRPWDREKHGMPTVDDDDDENSAEEPEWTYKAERLPMSQEEWNEYKRRERNPDFAPMPAENRYPGFQRGPTLGASGGGFYQNVRTSQNYNNIEGTHPAATYARGAAIPPPSNLDTHATFIPPATKRPRTSRELEQSVEAGLRFLRNNVERNQMFMNSS